MIVILKRLKQQLNNISSHVLITACSTAIQIAKNAKISHRKLYQPVCLNYGKIKWGIIRQAFSDCVHSNLFKL